MIYEKLAIITDNLETSEKVIKLFAPYMAVNVYTLLSADIILLDTNNGVNDWIEIIKDELNINVEVLPIETLKFTTDAPKELVIGIENFIKKTDISDDIDYFLDLINEKGSKYLLTPKEQQRLNELSKK